jgi:parallel beta-helix repeat protein
VKSSNNTIRNNIASNNYEGICFWESCNNNIITNNNASLNAYNGISIRISSNNTISYNNVSSNGKNGSYHGLLLWESSNNTVMNNIASDNKNESGICITEYSSNNIITNNIASGNAGGIGLGYGSSNNTIMKNTASNNEYGINFWYSSNNRIYLNNFINNNQKNVDYPYGNSNIWSSTEKIPYTYNGNTFTNYLGNYWDDYAGSDANGDGIGETPYPIGSDADNYPLVEPFENYAISDDITPPNVSSIAPQNGQPDVAIDIIVTATFSEAMDSSSITTDSFTLAGSEISGMVTYDPATYTAAFTPDADLDYNHEYTATLSTAITDSAGNPLAIPYTWSFTTGLASYKPKLSIPVYAPLLQTAHVDTTLTYLVEVTNEGDKADTIDLSLSDMFNWHTQLSQNPVTLTPGESTNVYLEVSLGENTVNKITITGTSQGNTSQTSSCNVYAGSFIEGYGLFATSLQFSNEGVEGHTVNFAVPDYVKISNKALTLGPSETKSVNLVFDPKAAEADLDTIHISITDIKSGESANIPIKFGIDEIVTPNFDMAIDSYSFPNFDVVTLPINDIELFGNCYGMSETSILYFKHLLALPNDKLNTYSLTKDEVAWRIRLHQWQAANFILGARILLSDTDQKEEYDKLEANLAKANIADRNLMILCTKKHAVVAYEIIKKGDTAYIFVYDSEQPYDMATGNFYLSFPYATYNLNSHEFDYHGDSRFLVQEAKTLPGDKFPLMLIIACPVNATITDQYGRIISDEGTNEIPDASIIATEEMKIFYLPAGLAYSAEMDAYHNGTFSFTRVSPINGGISVTKFEDISITETTIASVEIEPGVTDYQMDIDYDGDGTIDEQRNPDVCEVVDTTPSSGCFVATAAYGTPMANQVQILRDFRDQYMLTNPLGQAFVNLYYKTSPSIAEFIMDHPSLKPIVRGVLVPAVVMSTMIVNTTTAEKIAALVLLVLISVAVASWVIRRRDRDSKYT